MSAIRPEGLAERFAPKGPIADLIRNLFGDFDIAEFFELIRNLNPAPIKDLIGGVMCYAEKEVWTGEDGKLACVMKAAKAAALMTKTTQDDAVVGFIDDVLRNVGVLNVVAVRVQHATTNPTDPGYQPMTADDHSAITRAGLDIDNVMRWISAIQQIVRWINEIIDSASSARSSRRPMTLAECLDFTWGVYTPDMGPEDWRNAADVALQDLAKKIDAGDKAEVKSPQEDKGDALDAADRQEAMQDAQETQEAAEPPKDNGDGQ